MQLDGHRPEHGHGEDVAWGARALVVTDGDSDSWRSDKL